MVEVATLQASLAYDVQLQTEKIQNLTLLSTFGFILPSW